MPYTVVSVGGAGNLPATNEVPVDLYSKVMSSYSKLTPLTVLLNKVSQGQAKNIRIDHIQDNAMPTKVTCATTESSPGTSISVIAYGPTLVKDTLLFNPSTLDIRSVDATPTTNAVTVTINAAGTTSAAWTAGDVLHVLPPQIPEDDEDTYRTSSVADDNVYNYIQLVRLQYSITRIMDKMTTVHGGPGAKRASLKAQKYREFREKWEKLIYFGGRSSSGTAPTSTRTMGGLTHFLKDGTLYKDFGGTFTESGFDNFLLSYFEENPDTENVMMAVAPNVRSRISYWGKGKIRLSPNSTKYGMWIQQYKGAVDVDLITLPLLNDQVTKGWGWILDLSRIMMNNLDNPMFFPDAKNVGQSEKIYDLYRVATTMRIANENKHAMFVGATL